MPLVRLTARPLTRLFVALLWLGGALAACSEDAEGTADGGGSSSSSSGGIAEGGTSSSSSSGGSSSGAPAGDASHDAADAATATSRGIFFTQQRYTADFAAAQPQDARLSYADGLCQQAATAAGLLGQYQAILAVSGPDAVRPLVFPASGSWCAVRDGAPDCSGDGVIFPTEASFASAPQHALTTDELGNPTNPSSKFLSGVAVGSDDGYTSRTCNAWSSDDEAAGQAGVGTVTPSAGGAFGSWLTGIVPCDEVELPLLCVWTPTFGPGPDN